MIILYFLRRYEGLSAAFMLCKRFLSVIHVLALFLTFVSNFLECLILCLAFLSS